MNSRFRPIAAGLPEHLGGSVTQDVADELIREGCGGHCGHCQKPFTAARKRRGVGRVTHVGENGAVISAWVLCGRCMATMRRNGGQVSHELIAKARRATQLAMAPARGTA